MKERALCEKALRERLAAASLPLKKKIPFEEFTNISIIIQNNLPPSLTHTKRREEAEKQLQRVLVVARHALVKTLGGGGRDRKTEESSERVVDRFLRRTVK